MALLLAACGGESSTAPAPPPTSVRPDTSMAPEVRSYLVSMLDIMQANSLNRLTIDWTAMRAATLSAASGAQRIVDLRPAVRTALTWLGDGHSSYRAADGTTVFVSLRTCQGSVLPDLTGLPSEIGYVRVGSFGGQGDSATAFATSIQNAIRAADRDSLIGWIVDLRGNFGGNMWPMIAGLGPIVGPGALGAFVYPDGREFMWYYRDGGAWLENTLVQSVPAPYTLRKPNPRVAVLADNWVASSGEATLLAFRNRPNSRSFGVPTCGLSTANGRFPLSDGGALNLTVAVMADRSRVRAGDQIEPDETILGTTATINRAVAWLRSSTP
jgi:hypothetical protein